MYDIEDVEFYVNKDWLYINDRCCIFKFEFILNS